MLILKNKKAYFDYSFEYEIESGIILTGSEVKSIRDKSFTLNDSYVTLHKGEVWVNNLRVSKYRHIHPSVIHDENRKKKLLLTKKQISKIEKSLQTKGNVCIPVSVLSLNNRIKLKIGIGRGKKLWDKRDSLKKKDIQRDLERSIR